MSAANRRPPPKPWPMKWVVLAIVVGLAGYTAVNLYYRKPGRGYRPYQDAQDRATTARLLAAGWHKLPIDERRPAEKPALDTAPAAITRAAVGLGADFEPNFAEKPGLLASVDRVIAPAVVARGETYTAYFTATLPSQKTQLGNVSLYHREHEFVLLPSSEPLPGKGLLSRWEDSTYCVNIPTAGLAPGRYRMRIVAKGPAAAWSFTVK
ncbi:MAG: hypothetical protein JNG82_07400 [Opitutaceae bacterium]|nr:hypothetical protein [Opitutaceae bacterium]